MIAPVFFWVPVLKPNLRGRYSVCGRLNECWTLDFVYSLFQVLEELSGPRLKRKAAGYGVRMQVCVVIKYRKVRLEDEVHFDP